MVMLLEESFFEFYFILFFFTQDFCIRRRFHFNHYLGDQKKNCTFMLMRYISLFSFPTEGIPLFR